MESAQNSIYLQPDCRDFREHSQVGRGFIVLVSLSSALRVVLLVHCVLCRLAQKYEHKTMLTFSGRHGAASVKSFGIHMSNI